MSLIDRTLPDVDPFFDLTTGVGQRSATFRFKLIDGVTDGHLGDITPIRNASLSHDTTRTIKRSLNLSLGVADTMAIDPVNNRVEPFMVLPNGTEYPLGRYVFTTAPRDVFTAGKLMSATLLDEMFILDQPIQAAIAGEGVLASKAIVKVVAGFGFDLEVEGTEYTALQSWGAGAGRGQILAALALAGDYFSPWFDNHHKLRFIRSFDPATAIPNFDFDTGNQVLREPIQETDDLLTSPNRFIAIANSSNDLSSPAAAFVDVPVSAPHSIKNRGFVVAQVVDTQVADTAQAQVVARNLAIRHTVFERVTLTTPPDPRHDSYDVVIWNGQKWLELAWSMDLLEGGSMEHTLRKTYS